MLDQERRLKKHPIISIVPAKTTCIVLLMELAILIFSLLVSPALSHLGRPLRGSVKLSVLLCQYKDAPTPSEDVDFYERLIIDSGTTGLADYWSEVSDGAIDLDGSVVRGWYTLDVTEEQGRNTSPRVKKHTDCVDKAKSEGYTPPDDYVVVVVTSPFIDTFGLLGSVMIGEGMSLSLLGHETGHGIGMRHSFTTDTDYCNADWASEGEYGDPWDVMSHADTYKRSDVGDFRRGGPGLNAYHLDRMGTLEFAKMSRITLLDPALYLHFDLFVQYVYFRMDRPQQSPSLWC
jgi:hypothetical protein